MTGTFGGGKDVLRGAFKTLVCTDGFVIFGMPYTLTYDPATDTLTDVFGEVWERA